MKDGILSLYLSLAAYLAVAAGCQKSTSNMAASYVLPGIPFHQFNLCKIACSLHIPSEQSSASILASKIYSYADSYRGDYLRT